MPAGRRPGCGVGGVGALAGVSFLVCTVVLMFLVFFYRGFSAFKGGFIDVLCLVLFFLIIFGLVSELFGLLLLGFLSKSMFGFW